MNSETRRTRSQGGDSGYPADLTRTVQLTDGTSVTLRPIHPDDAPAEREFARRLSPRSRYLRLLTPLKELTPEMVSRLTEIDYEREMALVAVVRTPEGPRQIGVARYVRLEDDVTCEFAVVVSDEWQGKGVAHQLLNALIDAAQSQGLKSMVGVALAENEAMKRLARRTGFELSVHRDDGQLVQMTLSLQ